MIGWALGCRIDGGQTEYVRVPYATTGLNKIPDSVTDEQALFVGDILATGFWAARISEISEGDTVLIIGAGPTGICCLLCTMLKKPGKVIVCEKTKERRDFIKLHYPDVLVVEPEGCESIVKEQSLHGGADVVIKIDTTPLITHRFPLSSIEEAYDVFENKKDGVIKTAIYPG